MQINVSTRHGSLSEASQQRISGKAEKLLRFFDRLTSIDVIVDLKNETRPRVDMKVSAEHNHDFVAHDESENLIGSVEATVQKLEEQLRRHKERLQERHRSADSKRQMPDLGGAESADDFDDGGDINDGGDE